MGTSESGQNIDQGGEQQSTRSELARVGKEQPINFKEGRVYQAPESCGKRKTIEGIGRRIDHERWSAPVTLRELERKGGTRVIRLEKNSLPGKLDVYRAGREGPSRQSRAGGTGQNYSGRGEKLFIGANRDTR